jgi:hypothetical protein
MGQFANCCCDPAPTNARRQIWTSRPFGVFLRPYDVAAWSGDTTGPVMGGPSGTDIIGYSSEHLGSPRYYPWPRPSEPYPDSSITWEGTRYLGEDTLEVWEGTIGDGGEEYSYFYNRFAFADPNTGQGFVVTDTNRPSSIDLLEGYATAYSETQTATEWSQTTTYQYGTYTKTRTLHTPITYADQVTRCKDHLDYVLVGMTAAELRGPMLLEGTPNRTWVYSPYVGLSSTSSFLRVVPQSGTFELVDGAGVYTEWEFGTDQELIANSLPPGTFANGIPIYGCALQYGQTHTSRGASGDVFYDHAIAAGRHAFGGDIEDDAAAVVQYTCVSYASEHSCAETGTSARYTGISESPAGSQPTWAANLTCFSPTTEAQAGWYYFRPDGIVTEPTTLSHNFTLPSDDYWAMDLSYPLCCPP